MLLIFYCCMLMVVPACSLNFLLAPFRWIHQGFAYKVHAAKQTFGLIPPEPVSAVVDPNPIVQVVPNPLLPRPIEPILMQEPFSPLEPVHIPRPPDAFIVEPVAIPAIPLEPFERKMQPTSSKSLPKPISLEKHFPSPPIETGFRPMILPPTEKGRQPITSHNSTSIIPNITVRPALTSQPSSEKEVILQDETIPENQNSSQFQRRKSILDLEPLQSSIHSGAAPTSASISDDKIYDVASPATEFDKDANEVIMTELHSSFTNPSPKFHTIVTEIYNVPVTTATTEIGRELPFHSEADFSPVTTTVESSGTSPISHDSTLQTTIPHAPFVVKTESSAVHRELDLAIPEQITNISLPKVTSTTVGLNPPDTLATTSISTQDHNLHSSNGVSTQTFVIPAFSAGRDTATPVKRLTTVTSYDVSPSILSSQNEKTSRESRNNYLSRYSTTSDAVPSSSPASSSTVLSIETTPEVPFRPQFLFASDLAHQLNLNYGEHSPSHSNHQRLIRFPSYSQVIHNRGKRDTYLEKLVKNFNRPNEDLRETVIETVERFLVHALTQDKNYCIARSICLISASPEEYGPLGRRVRDFFLDSSPRKTDLLRQNYRAAAFLGNVTQSKTSCFSVYPNCQLNVKALSQAISSYKVPFELLTSFQDNFKRVSPVDFFKAIFY